MIWLLDKLPLWAMFGLTVVLVLASVEIGFRLGTWRHKVRVEEKESAASTLGTATLGLLAFMLAFTFGLASSRYDDRRFVVLEESNAIGTAYLRTGFLPEAQREPSRALLRAYAEQRIAATRPGQLDTAIRRAERIQGELWTLATAAMNSDRRAVSVGLYVDALNAVIDVHSKRIVMGVRSGIPWAIWSALYLLTFAAMGAIGYKDGISGTSRTPAVLPLALGFSIVLWLIADLDRPAQGSLTADQHTMESLRRSMGQTPD